MVSWNTMQNSPWAKAAGYEIGRLIIGLMIMIVALALSGCASMEGKLTPSSKADVGYFADQTITMLSQADFEFTRNESIYTREFVEPDAPEEKHLYGLLDDVDDLFEKIINYSLNLVVIYETRGDNEARVAAYADYIEPVDEDVLRQTGLNEQAWVALVAEVRGQKKFMNAVEAAQPMLSGAGRYMNMKLNEVIDAADQVALKMEQRIDDRFAEVIRYHDALLEEKYAILRSLEQLYRAYAGETAAQNRLRQSKAIRKKSLVPQRQLSDSDLEAVGEHLMTRLDALHRIGEEIEPEYKIYRAAHQELDNLYDKMMESIRVARILTMVWVHAHYQMASGKSKPAEWFDIQKVSVAAAKAAAKAVF